MACAASNAHAGWPLSPLLPSEASRDDLLRDLLGEGDLEGRECLKK